MARRVAWRNGRILGLDEAALALDASAFRYSLVVFDGMRVFVNDPGEARIIALDRHLDRFLGSCDALGFVVDNTADELRQAVTEVVALERPDRTCAVRLFAYPEGPAFHAPAKATVSIYLLSLD